MTVNKNSPLSEHALPPSLPEGWDAIITPFLRKESSPGPGTFFSISAQGIANLAARLGIAAGETMAACLKHDIWPLRFKNNRGFFSHAEQARLLRSRAAIIGCGGLGGHVALLLARMGIGSLSLCDFDSFDESNLNRQAFCREDRLGMNKALAAKEELALIASHMRVTAHTAPATQAALPAILSGADIAIDCLDSIATRKMLEQFALEKGMPFVHGAIAGLEAFALASFPDAGKENRDAIRRLYGDKDIPKSETAEYRLGVPSPTPLAAALLQVILAVRILTNKPVLPLNALWHFDVSVPELEVLKY